MAPNDVYISCTTQLTSRRCILNIYSTNTLTEYFKQAAHSPFFFSSRCCLFHNATSFGSCNIHILNTVCAKNLKENSSAKGLSMGRTKPPLPLCHHGIIQGNLAFNGLNKARSHDYNET